MVDLMHFVVVTTCVGANKIVLLTERVWVVVNISLFQKLFRIATQYCPNIPSFRKFLHRFNGEWIACGQLKVVLNIFKVRINLLGHQ